MIVTQEMEDPMDQEDPKFLCQGVAFLRRLGLSPFYGDDHVSEEGGVGRSPFPHGEGEDVGSLVDLPVLPVQSPDPSVVHQEDAQFRRRDPESLEGDDRPPLQRPDGNPEFSLKVSDLDGHGGGTGSTAAPLPSAGRRPDRTAHRP